MLILRGVSKPFILTLNALMLDHTSWWPFYHRHFPAATLLDLLFLCEPAAWYFFLGGACVFVCRLSCCFLFSLLWVGLVLCFALVGFKVFLFSPRKLGKMNPFDSFD